MAIILSIAKFAVGTVAVASTCISLASIVAHNKSLDLVKGKYQFKSIIPQESNLYFNTITKTSFYDINGAGSKDFAKYAYCDSPVGRGTAGVKLPGQIKITKDNYLDVQNFKPVSNDQLKVQVFPYSCYPRVMWEELILFAHESNAKHKVLLELLDSYMPNKFFKYLSPKVYLHYCLTYNKFVGLDQDKLTEIISKANRERFEQLRDVGFNVYVDGEKT